MATSSLPTQGVRSTVVGGLSGAGSGDAVTVVDSAVGYLFASLVRRARRTAGGTDPEAGQALSTDMIGLHEVIATRLGTHAALADAEGEAVSGRVEPTERTLRGLTDALATAAAQDPRFAEALGAAVAGVEAEAGAEVDDSGPALSGEPDIQDAVRSTWPSSGAVVVDAVSDKPRRRRPTPAARRRPAPPRHLVGVIPPRAESFQYRRVATRLRAALSAGRSPALCVVLTGTSGAGKTQLAADHAHRLWQKETVEVLVWVAATTRAAVIDAYAQAGVEVCGAPSYDPERAAEIFLAWLGGRGRRWLVVLDDVADPEDLTGLWPPDMPSGRILVTAREWDVPRAARHGEVAVGVFTPADARDFLARTLAARGREESGGQLAGLAADLGRLPPVLTQAAAYLLQSGMAVADYRALLRGKQTPALTPMWWQTPLDGGFAASPAVLRALALSVEYADGQYPAGLARPLLRLISMLDPNGIPATVLTSAPALAFLSGELPVPVRRWWQRKARRAVVTAPLVAEALLVLRRLGLINHFPDVHHRTVGMHDLTQRMTRGTLDSLYHPYVRAAADAVLAAWDHTGRYSVLAQALRANTTALVAHGKYPLHTPETHKVLHEAGHSLGSSGRPGAAVAYFQRLTTDTRCYSDPHGTNRSTASSALDFWQAHAGGVEKAAAFVEEVLAEQLRLLGPDHLCTLSTRHTLASWQGDAGDPAGAVTALEALLADQQRALGPDHYETRATQAELTCRRGFLAFEDRQVPGSGGPAPEAPVEQHDADREDHGDADHGDPPGLQH